MPEYIHGMSNYPKWPVKRPTEDQKRIKLFKKQLKVHSIDLYRKNKCWDIIWFIIHSFFFFTFLKIMMKYFSIVFLDSRDPRPSFSETWFIHRKHHQSMHEENLRWKQLTCTLPHLYICIPVHWRARWSRASALCAKPTCIYSLRYCKFV